MRWRALTGRGDAGARCVPCAAWAIEPNCTGFVFGKDSIKGGCVPRQDALDDFEDYVNLLVRPPPLSPP